MIRSIQFATSHYAAGLPCIGSRKFTFPDKGLIVLFGPNGCGKSTLLRGMAHGTSTERGGWSRPPEPSLGSAEKSMSQILERWGSVVDWDGTASLYLDSSASDNTPRDLEENSDGLAEGDGEIMDTNIRRIFSPASSGLWRVSRLNKALDSLREGRIPDLSDVQWQEHNSTWAEAGKKFAEYAKSLKTTEIPALLLDEPERSLSISNAINLFHKVLLVTGSLVQVFVATHSSFVLDLGDNPHVHIIDMQAGYADECRSALQKISAGWTVEIEEQPVRAKSGLPSHIKTLGDAIRFFRERKGLSLRQLASQAKISAPFLSDIERNRRSTNKLLVLAGVLEIDVKVLRSFDGRMASDLKEWIASNPGMIAVLRDMISSGCRPDEIHSALRNRRKQKGTP